MHALGTIILSSQLLICPTSTFGCGGLDRVDHLCQLFSIMFTRSLVMGNWKQYEGFLALYHYLSVRIPLAKIWRLFNFAQNKTKHTNYKEN